VTFSLKMPFENYVFGYKDAKHVSSAPMIRRPAKPKYRVAHIWLCSFLLFATKPSLTVYAAERHQAPVACGVENDCNPPLRLSETLPAPPRFIHVQAALNPDGGNLGRWRLVRTPGPDSGEVVSIMRVADALKSDPDFAGLMIRCREKSALQIALVVIRPFPPRAHPQASISAGQMNVHFETSVIPPGSLLSLPNEAEVLARGAWQSATQLNVEIESDGEKIRGIVSLENLSNAIASLQANCSAQ